MTADRCPRLFEAEAMRDGRLGDTERASFERHAKTCPECAREVQALGALARALRESIPGPADELHVRRERTRLLSAFDRELLVLAPRSVPPGRLVWALAAAVLVAAVAVSWRVRPAPAVATPASRAVVRADPAAAWSERLDGEREDVLLEQGALWIHVDHGSTHPRLRVILPDGELEDTGTTFMVTAANGHTSRVDVEEGGVVLRLHGAPPVALGAGETWTPPVPAPSPCAAPRPSEPAESPLPFTPPMPSGTGHRAPSPPSTALPTDGSLDFRAATSALDRGDNREAAAGFTTFLARHPRDPRLEDAAYLRVIALERCGDRDAVKAAARDYLDRYPAGFRRAEVESLSR
jgi:hypothetical protein